MGLVVLAFLAIFVLVASTGLLLFYRAAMAQRLSAAVSPESNGGLFGRLKVRGASDSLRAVVQPFEKVLPKSPKEVSVMEKRLMRAGYRADGAVRMLYGMKVVVPLVLCALITVTGLGRNNTFFVYVLASPVTV